MLSAGLERLSHAALQTRGVRLSAPTMFKSSFKNERLRPQFTLDARFDEGLEYSISVGAGVKHSSLYYHTEEIRAATKSLMSRGPNGVRVGGESLPRTSLENTRGIWDAFGATIRGQVATRRELEKLQRYAIYAPQTGFLRGVENEILPNEPIGLLGHGLPAALNVLLNHRREVAKKNPAAARLMRNVLDVVWAPGWANSLSVENFNDDRVSREVKTGKQTLYLKDRFMRESRNKLSAYDSSEGTLFLAFMAVLMLHPDAPKIFALDNVDNALNPAMTTALLAKLIEVTCSEKYRAQKIGPEQVFLTSHNPTALDAFDLFEPDQRIFIVSRNMPSGKTTITPLLPGKGWTKEDWIKAKAGQNLSQLWIEGGLTGALTL